MVLMHTPVVEADQKIIDFSLKGTDGNVYTLADVQGENGTLVLFICNHCPYVKGIMDRLPGTMQQLQAAGIGVVAIMANDVENYSDDSFENMQKFAEENHFTFPYVIDETQEVAKAYGAVCTPDYFGYNAEGELVYRGRLDSSGKDAADENTVPELLNAMLEVAEMGQVSEPQVPSMGCSIKWKEA